MTDQPAYCAIHQHYKWCEHNGGVLGPTGYEAPVDLPASEREVRAYAAESGDVILRRHLTAVLAEYDQRGEKIEEMREKLRDIEMLEAQGE